MLRMSIFKFSGENIGVNLSDTKLNKTLKYDTKNSSDKIRAWIIAPKFKMFVF